MTKIKIAILIISSLAATDIQSARELIFPRDLSTRMSVDSATPLQNFCINNSLSGKKNKNLKNFFKTTPLYN